MTDAPATAPDAPAVKIPPTAAAAPPPAAEPEHIVRGLTPDEERQLGDLIARRDAAASATAARLRVTGGHESMEFGGTRIGRDWVQVPERAVADIMSAAESAGVEIERES